jgi:2,3-bisphosphoglycerate-independent phosphoglycerate mutase
VFLLTIEFFYHNRHENKSLNLIQYLMASESFKTKRLKPIVLIILDGWGIGDKNKGNAISNAKLPTFKKLDEYYPKIALQASGISVGLPWGEPGNSEVGHITLGTGKVIYQNMPRITMSIQDGSFYKNPVLLEAAEKARNNGKTVHLMGLVGKGSVHSNIDHLYTLIEMMKYQKVEKVFIHAFTDGRDSAPTSGLESIKELEMKMEKFGIGKIATIGGRYFAMDRNNNWDRVKKAYDVLVGRGGNKIESPQQYLKDSYKNKIYDEFIEPASVVENGNPIGPIKEGDSVIFFNYREDRAKQIAKAFVSPDFSKFPVSSFKNIFFATMTQYEEGLPAKVAFPPIEIKDCLGKIISENNLAQLRIAETEKFAHVTYFFNGGNEESFPGEDRLIVASKDVSDFAQAPEMSAREISEKVLENIENGKYDFILVNFANADMVGHTGNEEATIKAVETIDGCLEKIIKAVLLKNGCLLITADHGNAEEMVDVHTGERDTEHSSNPVPLWYVTGNNHSGTPRKEMVAEVSGLLNDIAPTILDIIGIDKPGEMTGESLLEILK